MKIENNGISPLNSPKAEGPQPVDAKHTGLHGASRVSGRDRAELSESARLLAKAHAALEDLSEVENERLEKLRAEINSGNYQVPVEEIARRLAARLFQPD